MLARYLRAMANQKGANHSVTGEQPANTNLNWWARDRPLIIYLCLINDIDCVKRYSFHYKIVAQ